MDEMLQRQLSWYDIFLAWLRVWFPAIQNPHLKSPNRNGSLTRKPRHASESCRSISLRDTTDVTINETAYLAVSFPYSWQDNAYGCIGV